MPYSTSEDYGTHNKTYSPLTHNNLMTIIEHCCYQKQLRTLFNNIAKKENRKEVMLTYSDFTISELLLWYTCRTQGQCTVTLATPSLTTETIYTLRRIMAQKYYSQEKQQNIPFVTQLNLITDGTDKQLTDTLQTENPDRTTCAYTPHSTNILTIQDKERSMIFTGELPQQTADKPVMRTIIVQDDKTLYTDIHNILDSTLRRAKKKKEKEEKNTDNSSHP